MVADSIRRIRGAEKEAEARVQTARADSKKLLAESQEAAERVIDEARRAARDDENALLDRARAEAQSDARKLSEESGRAVEATRAEGGARLGEAVKRVIAALAE